ncbi:SusD/RagB family nutrient-binding outer membrane lipoprotein [Polaribacter sp. MSW13]|uniref:SusD/RagB family nutrient-binding outer membrane lipoprotein n=1 Tax=Polaribacter marinus TaxID=2916838 RepID=A0A9X1VNH7_9FLAO|nr:SusD/RagB family nutrient-binding outer membrane lipoprotein [Polaribacter marinus]MCI2229779.1 SusD/RagB family nutrient-binding outer membrane lipoprotein [Polaribacter marinus]
MKKLKYIILSITIALSACDTVDFGDTNANLNEASEINAASVMAGAMMRYATRSGREYLNRPTLNVQYQSQVTYTDEMQYNEVPQPWSSYYVQTLSNLQTIIDLNSDPANHTVILTSQGSPANQIGVAMIMKSVIAKRITDSFGDCPYSEALDPSNITPKYDSQEDIYDQIFADIKAGRDMLNTAELGPTGDIIYGGDVAKWKKFANSFLLQASLQLSKKYPAPGGKAANVFTEALGNAAGVIEDVSDEAWFSFDNAAGFPNPWNANRRADYFLTQEFTDALKGNAGLNPTSNTTMDDRLTVYADDATKDGVPYGYVSGSGAGKSSMSTNFWDAEPSLPLLTASYTYLNRAEGAQRGWSSENATTMLTSGIKKSYESLDNQKGTSISGTANETAYVNARIADAAGNMLKVIAEEKWVSLFPSGFDAWSEWRRTNIPTLNPATDAINDGNIPRRYNYPSDENTLNGSNYTSGLSGLSPATDNNTSKVWWDQ